MVLTAWTRAFNLVFVPLLFVLLAGVREVEYRTGRISGSVSGRGRALKRHLPGGGPVND